MTAHRMNLARRRVARQLGYRNAGVARRAGVPAHLELVDRAAEQALDEAIAVASTVARHPAGRGSRSSATGAGSASRSGRRLDPKDGA